MDKLNKSGFIYLALVGAFIATLCDACHVYTQTLSYPHPMFAGQAFWVFPGFFFAFLLMAFTSVWLIKRCRSVMTVAVSQTSGNLQVMVESLITFVVVYLLSGFGNESPYLLVLIFYGTFFMRLSVTYERNWAFLLALILGIGGMFVEGLLSLFGEVTYRHVDVFGVPYWLGGLYMHGALALRECVRFFIYSNPESETA